MFPCNKTRKRKGLHKRFGVDKRGKRSFFLSSALYSHVQIMTLMRKVTDAAMKTRTVKDYFM